MSREFMDTAASETSGLLSSPRAETSITTIPAQKYFKGVFLPDVMANIFSFLEEDDESTQLFFLTLVQSKNYRTSLCSGPNALYPGLSEENLRSVFLYNNAINVLKKILSTNNLKKRLLCTYQNFNFINFGILLLKINIFNIFNNNDFFFTPTNAYNLLLHLRHKKQNVNSASSPFISRPLTDFLACIMMPFSLLTFLTFSTISTIDHLSEYPYDIRVLSFYNRYSDHSTDCPCNSVYSDQGCQSMTDVFHTTLNTLSNICTSLPSCTGRSWYSSPYSYQSVPDIKDNNSWGLYKSYCSGGNDPTLVYIAIASLLFFTALLFIKIFLNKNEVSLLENMLTNTSMHKKLTPEGKCILDYIQQPTLFQIPKRRKPAETSAAAAVAVHTP